MRQPGEQAAVVVEKRAGDSVLVGEQDGQKIAEPAQQDLVVGIEKLRPVRRLVAESTHLKEIARAFLELRRIDAQVDLHARLERVEARIDLPHNAQFAPRMRRHVIRAVAKPVDQFAAERLGFLRALLRLEVRPVKVGQQRRRNLAIVTAINFAREAPREFLGIRLAADRRADVGVEEIRQVDLRLFQQRAEVRETVPLAASLKKSGKGLAFGAGSRRGMGYGTGRHRQSLSMRVSLR